MDQDAFNKKSLIGWCLFDFANSIPAVIGGIFFSKWFVEDLSGGVVLLNVIYFISAIVIIVVGQKIGKSIDQNGYKSWIVKSSVISGTSITALFICTQFFSKYQLIWVSFLLFLFFLFSYQVGRISHNTYLRTIIPEKNQSSMSGYGTASNWAGSIVGIFLTIPVLEFFPGVEGRQFTFLVASIAYCVLTPVALSLMFKSKSKSDIRKNSDRKYDLNLLYSLIIPIVTYFLLFDVMATVQKNLPPYLSSVYGISDNTQSIGFLLILCMALLGGIFAAKFITFENAKIGLLFSTVSLFFSLVLIVSLFNVALWTSFALAGLSYGVLESSMRLHFMSKFSATKAGSSFAIFAVLERFSGLIGPILWIIPFYFFTSASKANIFSMLIMAFVTVVALFLMIIKKSRF